MKKSHTGWIRNGGKHTLHTPPQDAEHPAGAAHMRTVSARRPRVRPVTQSLSPSVPQSLSPFVARRPPFLSFPQSVSFSAFSPCKKGALWAALKNPPLAFGSRLNVTTPVLPGAASAPDTSRLSRRLSRGRVLLECHLSDAVGTYVCHTER